MNIRQNLLRALLCCAAALNAAIPASAQSVPGVNPATGETTLTATDWSDSGVHPISLSRHYRSWGIQQNGMGAGWSHAYAASAICQPLECTVFLGNGSTSVFYRSTASSPWLAQNHLDSLTGEPTQYTYSRASDETRWTIASGRLASITQRNGWTHTLAYNPQGRLASVTNAFGRSLVFGWDAQNRLTSITTPDNQTLNYSYDALSRLTTVRQADGATTAYLWDNPQLPTALTGIVDETGQRIATYIHDANGRTVAAQGASGAQSYSVVYPPVTQARLTAGTMVDPSIYVSTVQITDPLGQIRHYTWQGGDGQVRMMGAGSATAGNTIASKSFAALYLPASETDFMDITTMFTWDINRKLKTSTVKAANRPEAQTSSTQWHPILRLPVLITEASRTTAYTYDERGSKLTEQVTDPANGNARHWSWTYTAQGLADTMTDPLGKLWTYTYDSVGNRTIVRDPLGNETRYTYDLAGRVLTQSRPNRSVTSFIWDARGRLTSQSTGGETTAYVYTPAGLLSQVSLPTGQQVTYTYDAAQRLIAAVDNQGASIQYTLDAAGNRIREEIKDATGAIAFVTARTLNSLNKIAAISGASGTTAIGYDANGEATSSTDPLNQSTRQSLDGLRRVTATTFADNTFAQQAWSPLDQLTQVTDPKGVATGYVTNAFGEVMSETSPDIGTIRYTRDAAGNVIATQDAKGQITAITRDDLGRPTEIRYADHRIATFAYNPAGDVTRIEDSSGATDYERDTQGRVTSKTQDVNDNPSAPSRFKLSYSYQNGQLASITYPSGMKVSYRRTNGRITAIDGQKPTLSPIKPVLPWVSNLTYTALGQPKSWTWSNGDSAARAFDADGRMTATEFSSYGYDAASRLTSITQNLWASRQLQGQAGSITELFQVPITWSAGYDSRNRLTSFNREGAQTSYTYDANANRLTSVDQITSDSDLDGIFDQSDFSKTTNQNLNIEDTSNKMLGFVQTVTTKNGTRTLSTVNTPVSYTLDANGAMTSDGLKSFEYDTANRLSKVRIFKDGEAASVSYAQGKPLACLAVRAAAQAAGALPVTDALRQAPARRALAVGRARTARTASATAPRGGAHAPSWCDPYGLALSLSWLMSLNNFSLAAGLRSALRHLGALA